ncbi:Panacea domain-containing protein [Vibrio cyclitrophicus]|uniref:Panacea domain-containing protein n=1 Tax=Vibrio sp. OPT10 TaxID=2778640 RepID=UPI0018801DC9|nr:Panacea domain-containing protein [Vibrio sp. OPT10]MBE8607829.1 SocA family protein [Vibrio sp. OPT10]
MDKFILVVRYLLEKYPYKDELSASRLTKLVYLSDWKSTLVSDKQMTTTKWYFNHFGPYVDTLKTIANKGNGIELFETKNRFGNKKTCFRVSNNIEISSSQRLTREELGILDFVIQKTKTKTYDDFIKLVYSTYPVANSEKYDVLDLPKLASEYKEMVSARNLLK